MERIMAMLLGLRTIAALRARQAIPPIVPHPSLVADLARVFPDAAVAQAIIAFASPADEFGSAASDLPDTTQLARAIAAQMRDHPQLAPQIRDLHDMIATICGIGSFASADGPGMLDLHLASAAILRYVGEIYIKPAAGQPDLIVAGNAGAAGFRIDLKGASYAEHRVQIGYSEDQRYPRLLLRTLTKSASDARPRERAYWIQKANPNYDLEIYTHGQRLKGSFRTRYIDWPLVLTGANLTLHIPAAPGTQPLATDIADEHGQVIARCIRIVAQPGLTA